MAYSVKEQIYFIFDLILDRHPEAMILPCSSCLCCIYFRGEFQQTIISAAGEDFKVYSVGDSLEAWATEDEILLKFLSINPDIVYSPLTALVDGINHEDHR